MEIKRASTNRRSQQGFTLMELVVAMGITLTIFIAAMTLYSSGLKQSTANQAQTVAYESAREVVYLIDKDIKQAVVIPTTVTIAQGTFTPTSSVLVLKLPAWDGTNSQTVSTKFDTVIYQFVTTQVVGSVTHKCYNIRRIVVPDAASSRIAEDRWLLPYSANRDATDLTLKRSEPWVDLTPSKTSIFSYYIQDSVNPGKVVAKTGTDTYDKVPLVGTDLTVSRTYETTSVSADVSTQSRLRNWVPPP